MWGKTAPLLAFTFQSFAYFPIQLNNGNLCFLVPAAVKPASATLSNRPWFMVCLFRETEKGSLWYTHTIVAPGCFLSQIDSPLYLLWKMHLLNLKDQLPFSRMVLQTEMEREESLRTKQIIIATTECILNHISSVLDLFLICSALFKAWVTCSVIKV